MKDIIDKVREELKRNVDKKVIESSRHFFKEKIMVYGIKSADIKIISTDYFKQIKDFSKNEIFNLCEKLWESGYLEESFIACNWSYALRKKYEITDFQLFEKWVNGYVNNWASCDTLSNHTIGEYLEMYPKVISELKKWAKSENRWMRRAAAVSLIVPAKKGKFLNEIIEISNILLNDTDDLVQKGYGWMLKAASKTHKQEIFNYVISTKATMPRTALRYAIEKMPVELKQIAMKKD